MGALGVLFLLLILGQAFTRNATLSAALQVASWVLWAVFVAEFTLRAWLARQQWKQFWRRNWWQLVFLAVPFLRFARAITLLRAARGTGVVAAAVRGSRSAGRLLTDRLAWLAVVTTAIILSTGQLLVLTGSYRTYGQSLHDVAMTTITGEPLRANDTFSQVIELLLAAYSIVVFGTLAGALGAFFLNRDRRGEQPSPTREGAGG
ncbi:voltage-gated potassium channel [Micromonospora krabiensis]|uniref:Voltage-gated potassium channel n=2 Tax=Micromonospora krabiensis TaxID=307121 RepID=A0A1C3MXA1_9ACTN|nr:voltage-gated potassium channel [Micromonospora krabiensis]